MRVILTEIKVKLLNDSKKTIDIYSFSWTVYTQKLVERQNCSVLIFWHEKPI